MLEGKALEEVLPHKKPMMLLDKVLDYDLLQKKLTAEVEITKETLFYELASKGVPMWLGIEYMAQAIAALAGISQTKQKHEEPKIGFIIGTRSYHCSVPFFLEGDKLLIKVKELFVDTELAAFECIITRNDIELAKAQINVFQPESTEDFLNARL